jgi:Ca2+-binding RTX toxin-like protein
MPFLFPITKTSVSDALVLGELDSVNVRSTVSLTSTAGNGISGVGANHRALIFGQVDAALDGVALTSSQSAKVVIDRLAQITAGDDGIAAAGDATSILNNGAIVALGGSGIALSGGAGGVVGTGSAPPADPRLRLTNTGTITGATGVTASGRAILLVNDGKITGYDGIVIDISGGAVDTQGLAAKGLIVNRGTIEGGIRDTSLLRDTVRNSGLISGDVSLSNLAKSLYNSGHISGDITFENANIVLKNTGTIDGSITFKSGSGQIDLANGSVEGKVSLSNAGGSVVRVGDGSVSVAAGSSIDYINFSGTNSGVVILQDTLSGESYDVVGGASLGTQFSGFQRISGSNFNDTFNVDSATAMFFGLAGDDTLIGGAGANKLNGGVGADSLFGGDGKDTLKGDGGNDVLAGQAGTDQLTGGRGRDTFVFDATGLGQAAPDRIMDFSGTRGEARGDGDRIDLSAIDANAATVKNDPFVFIGLEGFHNVAGEVRYATNGSDAQVFADTNGDGFADLTINLDNTTLLSSVDFVL